MQYQYEQQSQGNVTQHWQVAKDVQPGDWLVAWLSAGESGPKRFFAVGRVRTPRLPPNYSGSVETTIRSRQHTATNGVVHYSDAPAFYENLANENGFGGEWGQRLDVEEWKLKNLDGVKPPSGFQEAVTEAGGFIRLSLANITKNYFQKIERELRMTANQAEITIEEAVEIVQALRQMILQGPPGTGKTYLARKLAEKLIGTSSGPVDVQKDFRCGFVQFHPSYDYVDFVEGLRPLRDANTSAPGGIGFGLQNGVFKEFCRRAGVVERILAGEPGNFASPPPWQKLEQGVDRYCGRAKEASRFWKSWILREKSTIKTRRDLIDGLPKFVFIIDEVNRAELSKVFGELMYALEPGYRGLEGKVKTQYSTMATEETFFTDPNDDWFFVPSNVLVIGTMNDIDRSVEVFDFALRRRFGWKSLEVDRTLLTDVLSSMLRETVWKDRVSNLVERAEKLNQKILLRDGLGARYAIGPAYFGKIAQYGNEGESAYNKLWEFHLRPLLTEYVHGSDDEQKFVDECKEAFFAGGMNSQKGSGTSSAVPPPSSTGTPLEVQQKLANIMDKMRQSKS